MCGKPKTAGSQPAKQSGRQTKANKQSSLGNVGGRQWERGRGNSEFR